jgi:hypothetical protein
MWIAEERGLRKTREEPVQIMFTGYNSRYLQGPAAISRLSSTLNLQYAKAPAIYQMSSLLRKPKDSSHWLKIDSKEYVVVRC